MALDKTSYHHGLPSLRLNFKVGDLHPRGRRIDPRRNP
jgi:hypothetical protein